MKESLTGEFQSSLASGGMGMRRKIAAVGLERHAWTGRVTDAWRSGMERVAAKKAMRPRALVFHSLQRLRNVLQS